MPVSIPVEVAVFVVELLSAVLGARTRQEAARAAIAVASKAAAEKAIKEALR
jgi:hypothetical protein